jgi:hypothetical protein
LCQILGFRLKGEDYLQQRVVLRSGDNGVCQVVIDEHPSLLLVRAIVCLGADDDEPSLYIPKPPGPLWPPDDMPSVD